MLGKWFRTAHRAPLKWRVTPLTRNLHLGRDLLSELSARQLIADVTRPDDLIQHLQGGSRTIYAGIDPTAKSLHAGHLIPLLCLFHFQLRGHNTLALIGGATALVGDPSGRMTERSLSEKAQIESNTATLMEGIQQFFSRAAEYALHKVPSPTTSAQLQVVNNLDWLKDLNLLDFLRSTGIHFRVNHMLARDSVKTRMSAHNGITFTEFTYQLLQGYDFYELFRTKGCTIQVGGSDQWGNILSGIDLINKAEGDSAGTKERGFALTTPLLTTSQGEKFGKSAGNAVWLDEKLTSYLDFYQFFLRTMDADVERYLKMFTLLPVEEIDSVVREHERQPGHRLAQKLLAEEVTLMIHRKEGLEAARVATNVLFGTDYSELHARDIVKSLVNDPRLVFCTEDELLGIMLPNLAANFGLTSSKSAARQLALGNGLYLNNVPQPDIYFTLERSHLIDGQVAILRAGKDKHLILALH
ncbi:tyrosyl-tRNA synthetase [Rhizopogon vinicolor AM-OR11-026]|uniref:Tyrosine--tRNA ligase n=1 Tax=Rhizopogon vinicolor AM-OR11-026 TaxID=1314800 RepID=A0A1B7N565_9AGAM|nr:tyrosyl-tRNA synthetase [Rhizopogon vinicolor AM-OR11-026]